MAFSYNAANMISMVDAGASRRSNTAPTRIVLACMFQLLECEKIRWLESIVITEDATNRINKEYHV